MKTILRVAFAAAAVLLVASSAEAADKLAVGPLPAWVKPLDTIPPAIGDAGSPVRLLLQDRQLHFGPEGDQEYAEQVAQVRTPQGLAGLGTIQLAWNPDTDTVVVHRLRILRDGQSIDILGKQQFAILRREANLEKAVVDGLLTATLQPEGLQVGDVVDFAYTVTHSDPVLAGNADRTSIFPPIKVDRLRVRATWDAKRPLQWRASDALDKPKVSKSGGQMELTVDMKDPPELKAPVGAPPRFYPFRELQVSAFKTWPEVSALMYPHFAKAAQLAPDSPLRAEAARIRAASDDPKVQASAALALVEDKIRYLAVVMNLGGYVPQDADKTWALRYGDCKAKTVMLLALLHELNIQAEPTVVSATRGDGVNERLPSVGAFDHVIVRAMIGGKVYWLDGTRTGDRNIDALRPPPFLWALPLRAAGADLMPIEQPPLTRPDNVIRIAVDASAGLDAPAKVHGELTLGGQVSTYLSVIAANQPAAEKEKVLKALFRSYSWIDIKTISAVPDPASGSVKVVMDGTGKPPFERTPGGRVLRIRDGELTPLRNYERDPEQAHRDAPYLVEGFPSYATFTLTVTLPAKGAGFSFDAPDLDTTIAGAAYTRTAKIDKGVATLQITRRTLVREVSVAEANKAKTALDELSKVRVALRSSDRYMPTEQDLAAQQAQTPTTAAGFIERGGVFGSRGLDQQAMADFNKAIELEPNAAQGYAGRALEHVLAGRLADAKADIAKAQQLDPRNPVTLHAAGQVAMKEGRYADAAAAFGRAADLRADNTFAVRAQAGAYMALGDTDKALASLAELERIAPGTPDLPTLRYAVYVAGGQRDKAVAELDAAITKAPDDARLHFARGQLLAQAGRTADADKAFARALEIAPTPEVYVARAANRGPQEIQARLADLDAAEKLAPGLPVLAARRAEFLAEAKRYDDALAALQPGLKAKPDDAGLLFSRADVYIRAGKGPLATKDFATLRAKAAGSAEQLNGLCWQQAIRGFALDLALADCDAALKVAPNDPNALDSRAFVLMRLGRLPEALAAYDAAVKVRPKQAESLFGRALTRQRLQQAAEAEQDFSAARAVDPGIDRTFAEYGLTAAASAKAQTRASADGVVDQRQP